MNPHKREKNTLIVKSHNTKIKVPNPYENLRIIAGHDRFVFNLWKSIIPKIQKAILEMTIPVITGNIVGICLPINGIS